MYPPGGSIEGRVRKAEAQHREAIAQYRGTVINAIKEAEDALTNQHRYRELEVRNLDGAIAATRTTALSLERYQLGVINLLEVVESQREELQAQRARSQSQFNRLHAAVQLMKALGGGWTH